MIAERIHALIPAAGQGTRAGEGGPKQFRRVAGRALLAHTVDAFRAFGPRLATLALVVASDDGDGAVARAVPGFPQADDNGADECLLPVGGATRAASVRQGLAALLARGAQPQDWVLVHDAARCLITPSQIEALIAVCQNDPVGGLLALPLADTLKEADAAGRVGATLPRAGKWLAQTPQMFRIGPLAEALDAAGEQVTDEASAMERAGLAPRLVPGSLQNFKVTYPEDFALAEAVLLARASAPARTTP